MPDLGRAAVGRKERLEHAVQVTDNVLRRLARQGLTRLSPASVVELQALVQTAHHAGLVHLERTLESLGTTMGHYLDRDPNFRAERYLARLNRAWLQLAQARAVSGLPEDPADHKGLLGVHRRSYVVQERPITVQALGASGWVSDSGFVGVTVLLVDETDRLLQLSNVRPSEFFGSDPRRLLQFPVSDYLDQTIQDLAHGAFTLHGARLSDDGRISVSGELGIQPAAWSAAAYDSRTVSSCAQIAERMGAGATPLVGAPATPLLLEGFRWSNVRVDDINGVAVLGLRDAAGAQVRATVPLRAESNQLIDNLQAISKRPALQPAALFGRVRLDGGLVIEPLTAVYGEPRHLELRRGGLEVNELHLGIEDVEALR